MKRDHFEDLKAVVACLKPNEVRTARKFITAFEGNATKGKNKSLLLFELILKKPELNRTEVAQALKLKTKKISLDKLTSRLTKKLSESLILNVNLNYTGTNSKRTQVKFEIRKQLMITGLIASRGLTKMAIATRESIIDLAKRFELYPELIEVSELLSQRLEFYEEHPKHKAYKENLIFYKKCREALASSKNSYHKHFSINDRKGLNNGGPETLKRAILDIERFYEETNSKNIGFYLYTLKIEYFLANENYQQCSLMGYKLIELVTTNFEIFNDSHRGGSYCNLAENYLFLFEFDKTLKNISIAQYYFSYFRNTNFLLALEIECTANFYNRNLSGKETIWQQLLENTESVMDPFRFAKRTYLKSCFHFVKAEYKEAQQLLHSTKEIENDKEGWNIGKRLLTILIHLEQDDWDQAETAITNLRMHIQRLKPEGTVRKRDAVILKVLQKLLLASFDYQQVLDKHPELFEQLDRTDRDYRWQVKSPEMVVFHHWFQDKAQGVPYQFRVPEPLTLKFGAKSPATDLDI